MKRLVAIALTLAAARAGAHSLAPDEVVAAVAEPAARVAMGVERATIDGKNPRVLLIRVGPGWFGLPADARVTAAEEWRSSWRSATPQGVVAVLDAGTSEPVVRFGLGGQVVGLRERPQR
jgi:hypothetical protein